MDNYRVVNHVLWYTYLIARRFTPEEEKRYHQELVVLYVKENLSIREVGIRLGISEKTVFQRLQRFGITADPVRKRKYLNKRNDIVIPSEYSPGLAEFFGIMLGDGHVSHFQTFVTLGTKELPYVLYVQKLIKKIFGVRPSISTRATGYHDIYIGSVVITKWLREQGLVTHKVRYQVAAPHWISKTTAYQERFLRGFFDSDGSIYLLRYGVQLEFTNYSRPLLESLHMMLKGLGYKTSKVSFPRIYITRRTDVKRFFRNIKPKNPKHQIRFKDFTKLRRSYSGNYTAL